MNTVRLAPNIDYYEQLYLLLMQTAHFHAQVIYDRYEESEIISFKSSFEELWKKVEDKKELLFSRLGSEVRRAVMLANQENFTDAEYAYFVKEVERETWNFIYETFIKPKK